MNLVQLQNINELINSFLSFDLAIDIGSVNTRIYVRDKGLVVMEPTTISRQKKRGGLGEVLAVGKKAERMRGKQPAAIEIINPIQNGIIVDFDSAYRTLDNFFGVVRELPSRFPKLVGPRIVVGIPTIATEVERRAVKSLLERVGGREIFLVEKPLLSAVGIGLPVQDSGGIFLIDMGGDTTEIAVISLSGIVVGQCLKVGGKQADDALVNFIRLKYGVLIGPQTARQIKEKIGSLIPSKQEGSIVIRGRDLGSGLPKSLRIREGEVREALVPLAQKIVVATKEVMEESPPELTQDFLKRGVALTGGFSSIEGVSQMMTQELGMPCWAASDPQLSVVKGAADILNDYRLLKRVRLVAGLK